MFSSAFQRKPLHLVTSNLSFSHIFTKILKNTFCFYHPIGTFTTPNECDLKSSWKKEKDASNKHFLLPVFVLDSSKDKFCHLAHNFFFFFTPQNRYFYGDILESTCLSVRPFVHLCTKY